METPLSRLPSSTATSPTGSGYGASPEVDEKTMGADNRVVTSVDAAVNLTETDIRDARNLIRNARRITAKKQGAPPYNNKDLKDQGKAWKRNFSTRFLQKELNRAAPRFYMPVLTASTMTAAELPAGWPEGQKKTQFFRDTMTRAIRGWRKNDMFWRGLASEVVDYGFGFASWTDPYEWRPHLCRMDRGFVPRGTEVMDENLQRFTLKWDYQPNVLLEIVRKSVEGGSENWQKDAVAAAVQAASLPAMPSDYSNLRKWEEMIREQAWDFSYTKTTKVIECRHLYVVEFNGKVSHYILWPSGPTKFQLLYEHLDAYERTDDVVVAMTFGYGDGTIHGSWGAGQLLYDLAAQVERVRNDSIDNLLNSNKQKLQVASAKDVATAQLVVNDTMIIATGATFAGNVAAVGGKSEGYLALDDRMTQWAQEIVGDYLPPIPLQPSDIKAAQVNAALAREQEAQRDVLEAWMKQVALVVRTMISRMLDPDSDDEYAKGVRKKLLGDNAGWLASIWRKLRKSIKILQKITPPPSISLTEEEIEILINQPVIQSVTDFTEYAASQRAQFASSVMGNPLFNQSAAARYMAAGVPGGGDSFVESIVVPDGDITTITAQQRQQQIENTTMLVTGEPVQVVVTDNHYVHWQGLAGKPIEDAINGGLMQAAVAGLTHLAAHYAAGVSQKTWPPDQINEAKATLARYQRAMEEKAKEQAAAQQQQFAEQGAPQISGQQLAG